MPLLRVRIRRATDAFGFDARVNGSGEIRVLYQPAGLAGVVIQVFLFTRYLIERRFLGAGVKTQHYYNTYY